MDATRSARRGLLFRGRRDRERSDLGLELARIESVLGLDPILRSELEISIFGPMRQHAKEVSEIALGIESMELCGSDHRKQSGGGLRVVVATDKKPVFTT